VADLEEKKQGKPKKNRRSFFSGQEKVNNNKMFIFGTFFLNRVGPWASG
jgi:hypothetical protein